MVKGVDAVVAGKSKASDAGFFEQLHCRGIESFSVPAVAGHAQRSRVDERSGLGGIDVDGGFQLGGGGKNPEGQKCKTANSAKRWILFIPAQ